MPGQAADWPATSIGDLPIPREALSCRHTRPPSWQFKTLPDSLRGRGSAVRLARCGGRAAMGPARAADGRWPCGKFPWGLGSAPVASEWGVLRLPRSALCSAGSRLPRESDETLRKPLPRTERTWPGDRGAVHGLLTECDSCCASFSFPVLEAEPWGLACTQQSSLTF